MATNNIRFSSQSSQFISKEITEPPGFDGWSPADTTTLGWYDASDADSVTEVDGDVSQWDDLSGNLKHATQDTGVEQPSYATNVITGDNNIFLDLPLDIYDGQSAGTVVFIGKQLGASAGWGVYSNLNNIQNTNNANGYPYSNFLSDSHFWGNNIGSILNTQALIAYYQSGTELMMYQSGGVSGGPVTALDFDGNIVYAKLFDQGAGYSLYELVFLPDDTDRQKTEGYLAWKWDGINSDTALVDALPGDHPYKSAKPE